jgi:nicotinamidase-related amidase
MANISLVAPTFDTHQAFQIFHAHFLINDAGEHPAPYTMITANDIRNGTWKVTPGVTWSVTNGTGNYSMLQNHLLYYVEELEKAGKYALIVWPYHTMLGGVGHALDPAIAEALHVHALARNSQWDPKIKGGNPLTENYSVMCPEIVTTYNGNPIAQRNVDFLNKLATYDVIVIAGQAKSHCVAWTIADLLNWMQSKDPKLAEKVYLLEDCTSPVVTPFMDFTADADEAFQKFADAGMHIVQSTTPIEQWPGVRL